MKKFILTIASLCFCSVVCPDASIIGMQNEEEQLDAQQRSQEAQRLFQQNDQDGLFDWFCDNYEDNVDILGNRNKWLNLIRQYVTDKRYTNTLNVLLMIAAAQGAMDIAQAILDGNIETSVDRLCNDSTAIHEAAEHGNIALLNMFLEKRSDSDFAVADGHGFTPLDIAIIHKSDQVVRWFLNLHDTKQKEIGLDYRNSEGRTVLGTAVCESSLEIALLLMNHRDSHDNYDVSLKDPDNESSNVLVQAVRESNYDAINAILDSGRIDLNTITDTLIFNKTYRGLSDEIITLLRDKASESPQVLNALDVYAFWQNVENNNSVAVRQFLNSSGCAVRTVARAISSGKLELKKEAYTRIYQTAKDLQLQLMKQSLNPGAASESELKTMACQMTARKMQLQSILHALDIHSFREATAEENQNSAKALMILLTSEYVDYDDVIMVLDSENDMLPLPTYNLLRQMAQNAQRKDVIQAIQNLDHRVFQKALNRHLWQEIIELLKNKRVYILQQEYNDIREQINTDLQQMANQNRRQILQTQIALLDLYFFTSRFDSQGWNELPDLLDSHCFDNLIRIIPRRVFDELHYRTLDAKQQAANQDREQADLLQGIIDRLDQIRGDGI